MKLRYMIDSIVADREATVPEYVPVGVWVQGPGPGLDVEMYYLDRGPSGLADRKDEAAWVVNRLVEAGATNALVSARIAAEVLAEACAREIWDEAALRQYPYRLWNEIGPSLEMGSRLSGLRTPKAITSLIKSATRRPHNAGWISGVLLGSALPSEDLESFLAYINFFAR
jgi:hypothetical protein